MTGISSNGTVSCATDEGGAGSGDNVSVNDVAIDNANFVDDNPAAPGGSANVHFQKDTTPAPDEVSAYVAWADLQALSKTLTNTTLDAEGTGNSITTVSYVTLPTAVCQAGTAALAGSTPASPNTPTATCHTGTNTIYGTASFSENTSGQDQRWQNHFPLPPDWTGSIDLSFRWLAPSDNNTGHNVVWQIQTACVADGEAGDPSWNTAQKATDAAKGTLSQFNDAVLDSSATLTTTGCSAGEELFTRVLRDATDSGDTLTGAAELVWVQFKLRRTQ